MSEELTALVREEIRRLDAYHVPRPRQIRAKLDANESPYALPPKVAAELGRELASIDLNRYPLADCAELRGLVAEQLGVPGENLVFGNGSDELIALLISAFSEPREGAERARIMYPVPSFVVFRIASIWCGVEPVEVALDHRFELDLQAIEDALVARRPNVIFFARPNNPTGTLWPAAEVLRIARENPDIIVVDDEAYIDYGGDSLVDHVAEIPNLVVMRTLSKVGMAALRVGYLYANPAVRNELEKVRPPYNIGALNQRAAVWLLENHGDLLRDACKRVSDARAGVAEKLAALPGVQVFESRANLLLLRIGTPGDGRANEVWEALAERGIMIRNFDKPGLLSGCVRVTIGTPEENQLLLESMAEIL